MTDLTLSIDGSHTVDASNLTDLNTGIVNDVAAATEAINVKSD